MGIGGSSALEIPGGGTEGYHVLKVFKLLNQNLFFLYLNSFYFKGSR
jgi:hypothetical protein